MNRYWKACRFVLSILSRTAWLFVLLPFVADKNATRAKHQRRACAAICRILHIHLRDDSDHEFTGALIASNHVSPLDPFLIASVTDVAFAGKVELLDWPVIGWICRTVGLIAVHRDRRMETNTLVEALRNRLECGVNVVVFPEGTTSSGATVLPFKTGAFAAVEYSKSVKIYPTCINVLRIESNRQEADAPAQFPWTDSRSLPEYAWDILGFSKIELELRFGTPFAADTDRKSLASNCREIVVQMHKPIALIPENLEPSVP
jgi:1-acyl-sn-glycerol-3-phosphate acyltransferase